MLYFKENERCEDNRVKESRRSRYQTDSSIWQLRLKSRSFDLRFNIILGFFMSSEEVRTHPGLYLGIIACMDSTKKEYLNLIEVGYNNNSNDSSSELRDIRKKLKGLEAKKHVRGT